LLYAAGDPCAEIFIVRVGVFKTFTTTGNRIVQVTGFQMPGDVIGLDGIETGRHPSASVALEDAEVFIMPLEIFDRWSRESAFGQRQMTRMLAGEMERCQQLMLMLGTMRAEQRLASFLLELSERYGRLGFSHTQLVLRMSRVDIGSYLGLKLETVSRLMSRFQQKGLIRVLGKSINLLDVPALWQASGLLPGHPWPAAVAVLGHEGELLVA
jgi:CRP/FNR family transcriptional regulator